jgi:hypothetical protein
LAVKLRVLAVKMYFVDENLFLAGTIFGGEILLLAGTIFGVESVCRDNSGKNGPSGVVLCV